MKIIATPGTRANGSPGSRIKIVALDGELIDEFDVPTRKGISYCEEHPTGRFAKRFLAGKIACRQYEQDIKLFVIFDGEWKKTFSKEKNILAKIDNYKNPVFEMEAYMDMFFIDNKCYGHSVVGDEIGIIPDGLISKQEIIVKDDA